MEERALLTLKGMLNARSFKVETPELLGNPLDDTKMYNFNGVLVVFSEKSRINESNLNSYINFAKDNSYTNGLIIVSQIPSSESILNLVRNYINVKENPMLQIFDIRRLQFDITTHRKVPSHRIISSNEIAILEKKFNIINIKQQLPWIDSQDAMAKWIGARPTDIIEIVRFSESAGSTPYYRYCVSNVLET